MLKCPTILSKVEYTKGKRNIKKTSLIGSSAKCIRRETIASVRQIQECDNLKICIDQNRNNAISVNVLLTLKTLNTFMRGCLLLSPLVAHHKFYKKNEWNTYLTQTMMRIYTKDEDFSKTNSVSLVQDEDIEEIEYFLLHWIPFQNVWYLKQLHK